MRQSGQNLIVVDIFAIFDQSGSVNDFKPGWRTVTLGQLAMGREIHNGHLPKGDGAPPRLKIIYRP